MSILNIRILERFTIFVLNFGKSQNNYHLMYEKVHMQPVGLIKLRRHVCPKYSDIRTPYDI